MRALVVFAVVAAAPLHAAAIRGTYASPLGHITFVEAKDGTVSGTAADKENPCGFPPGALVFSGARLDRSLAGTFRVCRQGDGCSGVVDADAILVVGNGALAGSVHVDAGACRTPLQGKGLTLQSVTGKKPKAAPKPKRADAHAAAVALVTAAKVDIDNGEAEAARKRCTEAVALDPQFSQGYTCLGVTFMQRDRFDEALTQYQKAIEIDPANPDPYYNIACIYSTKKKTQESIEYLKLAVLNGYIELHTLSTDPELKNLHGDPAFEKLKLGQFD